METINNYLQLMRFNKPIGTFLLLWPTWIALFLAANGMPELKILMVFTSGVILMRAAGCVINDFADRHFDAHVTRTKNRPLAQKKISSKHALCLFFILIATAFFLVLQLNKLTILLSFIAVALATFYPFCKRFTYFPQVILGLAFGWGVIMAYAAVLNYVPIESILLYFGIVAWIIAFDTQYAMADKEDDIKIGIKSTAIAFGEYNLLIIFLLQLIFISVLILIGLYNKFGIIYFIGITIAAILFLYQNKLLNTQEYNNYLKAFINNNYIGMFLFIFLLISN